MHDERHEERILLGERDAALEACPGCREFRAALGAASDSARGAALTPPAWLDARVLGRGAPSARWSWFGAGLAAACAAAALVVLPSLRPQPSLHWTNGLERDIAAVDAELADLSKQVALQAETVEFTQDLEHIEAMAKRLKRQKL